MKCTQLTVCLGLQVMDDMTYYLQVLEMLV